MSILFNTASDRISADQMRGFASILLGKPAHECTAHECMAAVPAIRAFRNGAPYTRVKQVYQTELERMIE